MILSFVGNYNYCCNTLGSWAEFINLGNYLLGCVALGKEDRDICTDESQLLFSVSIIGITLESMSYVLQICAQLFYRIHLMAKKSEQEYN